jgi:hypothetical protein
MYYLNCTKANCTLINIGHYTDSLINEKHCPSAKININVIDLKKTLVVKIQSF